MLQLGKTKAEILTYINSQKSDVVQLEKASDVSNIAITTIWANTLKLANINEIR